MPWAVIAGALNGALAVVFGAFGAHALKAELSAERLAVYQTAVDYHFYHALALVLAGLLAFHLGASAVLHWASIGLLAGIVLFSGSLYALSLSGVGWLGAITPLGGTAFILGWLALAWAALRGV